MTTQIRMSGLGGQGVVTAAHILGSAAVLDGKVSTVNPFFGAEKRLAPSESYARIADEPIYDTGEVLYPDIIMIFHHDVIIKGKSYTMPFFSGIKKDGIIIINFNQVITFEEEQRRKLEELNVKVFFLPANDIAVEVGGNELSANIAMLGGLMGVTGIVTHKAMEEALKERFGGKGKFIASGTTAVLDEAIKKQYSKIEQLLAINSKILNEAYNRMLVEV